MLTRVLITSVGLLVLNSKRNMRLGCWIIGDTYLDQRRLAQESILDQSNLHVQLPLRLVLEPH